MSCKEINSTLTYDEGVKGWTSFHSFVPDFMVGVNNDFFSFKNGDLYMHHSPDVGRNTYYNVLRPSKVELMVNDAPSEVKELQAISIEGNATWQTIIKAFISNSDDFIQSSVKRVEFVKKEGFWYAYARRSEAENFDSKSTYGIGQVTLVNPITSTVTVNGFSSSLTSNDTIIRGNDLLEIGTVVTSSYAEGVTEIQLDTVGPLLTGDFLVGAKDSRIEGGNLRGYTMKMELTNDDTGKVELFAVNAEVMKSFT